MSEIDTKVGMKILLISVGLFLLELIIYLLFGVAAQGASGEGARILFNSLFFLIILTVIVGVVSMLSGILNKSFKTHLNKNAISIISITLAVVIYFLS